MKNTLLMGLTILAGIALVAGLDGSASAMEEKESIRIYSVEMGEHTDLNIVEKSPAQWREVLTVNQYRILREDGTEPPYRNAFWDNKREGIYRCAGCGIDLFSSATKYDSRTGWPSFWEPVSAGNVREVEDNSFFMRRIEVECARCGGHLGHVFNDGPPPTGLRYCINSASLTFVEKFGNVSPEKKES